jgi:hypothetical protein
MAYKAAYAAPIDYSSAEGQAIEGMINGRVPPQALAAARRMMRADGVVNDNIHTLAQDRRRWQSRLLSACRTLQELDYITRGLNDVAEKANAAGKLGGTTNEGRIYGNLAVSCAKRSCRRFPEYGIALDTAGEAIGQRSALQFGSELLSPGVARDEAGAHDQEHERR